MSRSSKTQFIAVAVGQGDAFFIDISETRALIDGGRSRIGFPTQFKMVTGLDQVDVLVCTHNDADHALGLLGFLESGFTASEVWLPASWMDRLDDLLRHPDPFFAELLQNIEEADTGEMHLSDIGNSYSTDQLDREREYEETNEIDVASLPDALETASENGEFWKFPLVSSLSISSNLPELYRLSILRWGSLPKFQLLLEALSAATHIRRISLAAFHSGALIRWFDYSGRDQDSIRGGIRDYLVPVNSQEVVRVRRPKRSVFKYLALTTANRESLVFLYPGGNGIPPALFTADSDLRFNQPIPWSRGMLITAPHHGSESNANAYKRFKEDTNGTIDDVAWVRSDGRFRSRPGKSYLLSAGRHYCTLCRGSRKTKQDLRLVPRSNAWQPVFTRKCRCV